MYFFILKIKRIVLEQLLTFNNYLKRYPEVYYIYYKDCFFTDKLRYNKGYILYNGINSS